MLNVRNSLSVLLRMAVVIINNAMKTFAMLCTNIVLKAPITITLQPIVKMLLIVLRIAVGNAEI